MSETEKLLVNKYLNGAKAVNSEADNSGKTEVSEKKGVFKKIADAFKKITKTNNNGAFANFTANMAAMWLYAPKEYSQHLNDGASAPKTEKKERKLPSDSVKISVNEAFAMLYAPREYAELKYGKGETEVKTEKKERKLPSDSVEISVNEAFARLYAPKEFSELKNGKGETEAKTEKKGKKLPSDSVEITAGEALMRLYSPKEYTEHKEQINLKAIKGKDGR